MKIVARLPISLLLTALLLLFAGCSMLQLSEPVWPPEGWKHEDYGSFSPDITYSYDNKYCAVQSPIKPQDQSSYYINVSIYENNSGVLIDSFLTQRAWDFWGICWEKDSYNIWIQSADIGTYCMQYADEKWTPVYDAQFPMPADIIDRFRMRQGSFQYFSAASTDQRYLASRHSDETIVIRNSLNDEILFEYPIDSSNNYQGLCWDLENNLWIRYENDAIPLRFNDDTWILDTTLERPEEVILSYQWDGTAH